MALRIVLHADANTAFSAGTTIPGHVELEVKKIKQQGDLAQAQVKLSFTGRSKITIIKREGVGTHSSTHYYHSKALLFTHDYTLAVNQFIPSTQQGGSSDVDGKINWPFEVHLPSHAEPISPETHTSRKSNTFKPHSDFPGRAAPFTSTPQIEDQHFRLPAQPLPGSIPDFIQHGTYSTEIRASVRYKLRAEVEGVRAGIARMWMGNKNTEVDVPVVNWNSPYIAANTATRASISNELPGYSANSLTHETVIRTLKLLPQNQERRLSIRERTRSIFKRSSLPGLRLELTVNAPQVIDLDQPVQEGLGMSISLRRLPVQLDRNQQSSNINSSSSPPQYSSITPLSRSTSSGVISNPPPSSSNRLSLTRTTSSSLSQPLSPTSTEPEELADSEIPTPIIRVRKISVQLVGMTAARSANGHEAVSYTAIPVFTWTAQDAPSTGWGSGSDVVIPVVDTTRTGPGQSEKFSMQQRQSEFWPDHPSSNGNTAGGGGLSRDQVVGLTGANAGASINAIPFEFSRALNPDLRLQHTTTLGSVGDFSTPNLSRMHKLEWEVRLDICGEEVRWTSAAREGGGLWVCVRIGDGRGLVLPGSGLPPDVPYGNEVGNRNEGGPVFRDRSNSVVVAGIGSPAPLLDPEPEYGTIGTMMRRASSGRDEAAWRRR